MGASKQAMMDEIHRISTQEYDEDDRAKNDDAAFCAKENYDSDMRRQYDNDELVEVIEDLQKKAEKDNG
jgi:predicted ATP-grasp superfamily ATP-dependent carboligase